MLKNLGEISSHAARRFGDKTALVFENRRFTFSEIDELASRLANGLWAKGVRPGDRVTLYSGNCWEWLVSYYGIAKTGAVVNPINVMLTPEEVGFVVNDCGAKAILASSDKGEALMNIKGRTPLEEVVLFGGSAPAGAVSFDELLANGKRRFDAPARDADDLSTICYTSGTTGYPKGAMQSHKAVITNAALTAVMQDGYFFVVDRKKDMILTGGYNIYPAEIERVLAQHPAVAMSAVGRKTNELKGEIAKAYIVLKPGAVAERDEMIAFCKQHLAAYKAPREVQFVDDLPKTSTGKIMRRDLPTLDKED